jgi:hypothetical protein
VPDPREPQLAREQQLARERATKEAAVQIEEQLSRERAAKEAAERAKLTVATPAPAPARSPQDQKAESQFWDCQPGTSGEIACNPAKKPAAPEAKAPAAPKPKMTAAEPASPPPAARQPQEQKADARLWDCQPKPPTGEVVCRPMGSAKQ